MLGGRQWGCTGPGCTEPRLQQAAWLVLPWPSLLGRGWGEPVTTGLLERNTHEAVGAFRQGFVARLMLSVASKSLR